MSSGGGGTTQTVNQQFQPPGYTQGDWQNYIGNATSLSGQGLPIYTGQTVAAPSQQAQLGIRGLTSLATQGSPLYDAGQANLIGTLTGGNINPYATQANPYEGQNPALQNMLDQTNQRITQNFQVGTAAQTDAAAARAGAYGGSGEQQAQALNARALGDAIGQADAGILGQNYYNSGNLASQDLSRASGAVTAAQQQQLQAAALAQGYQGSDINAMQAMMGAGDVSQQYQQNLLNAGQNLFNQYTQAPWTNLDLWGNALSRASGTGGTSTSQIMGPQTTWGQGLLGGGLIGGGLYNAFGT